MRAYPRRLYLLGLTFWISAIYVVRYLYLINNENNYIFSFHDEIDFDLINQNLVLAIPLFICFYGFSYIIPEAVVIRRMPHAKYKIIYYLYIAVLVSFCIATYIFGGAASGEDSLVNRIVFGIFLSVIPIKLLVFALVVQSRLQPSINAWSILIPYGCALLLFGSKAALLFVVFYYVSQRILFGDKLLSRNAIVALLLAVVFYPFLSIYSYYVRLGGNDFISFASEALDHITSADSNFFLQTLAVLSPRLSAIDVLSLPRTETSAVLSGTGLLIYFLKGLFVSQFVDVLVPHSSFGIGRVFAIEHLGQDLDLANAWEPSLFGLVSTSNDFYLNYFLVILILLLTMFFVRLFLRSRQPALMLSGFYILVEIIITVMTGTIQDFGFAIRSSIAFFLLYLVLPTRRIK